MSEGLKMPVLVRDVRKEDRVVAPHYVFLAVAVREPKESFDGLFDRWNSLLENSWLSVYGVVEIEVKSSLVQLVEVL